MDGSYRLDHPTHQMIYARDIEPALFLDTTAVEKPTITIIGGQPGAGKTKVLALSMKEFEDENVVIVNTDDLRAFHPKFKEIVGLDDRRSAERTHEDATAWKEKLLSRCIETRRNIILEGVFKDGHELARLITTLKKAGYEVTIRIVAVHERYSVWGIHKRYEKEKLTRGHGRFVPRHYHNECYQKLLDTVALVEEHRAADRIEVYNRDAECLYSSDNKSKASESAKAAIEYGRGRKLTEDELARYKESWSNVIEYMEKRKAPAEEIEPVQKQAEQFIKEADG